MSRSSSSPSPGGGEDKDKICRIVVQQCLHAQLRFDTSDPAVEIGRGVLIYTCFLQKATIDSLDSIVKAVLNAKLSEDGENLEASRQSLLHHKLDVLIIPQATLGGKLKGKGVQYHGLGSKQLGEDLFKHFVEKVKDAVVESGDGRVEHGIYGARQILSVETNGPFTHVLEF